MGLSEEPEAGAGGAPGAAPGVQDQGLPAHSSLQAGIAARKQQQHHYCTSDKTSLSLFQLSLLPRGVAGMGCSESPEVALSWRTKSLGSSSQVLS